MTAKLEKDKYVAYEDSSRLDLLARYKLIEGILKPLPEMESAGAPTLYLSIQIVLVV